MRGTLLGLALLVALLMVVSPGAIAQGRLAGGPSGAGAELPHAAVPAGVTTAGTLAGAPNAHFMPVQRGGPSPASTVGCNSAYNPCSLSYHSGPVMHNPTVVFIFWEPSGYNFDNNDSYSTNPSDAQYVAANEGFFRNATDSAWLNVSYQYTDTSGHTGRLVNIWGTIWDTNAFPCGACNTVSAPLTDAQAQSEIAADATAHSGPKGSSVEYFLFTPLQIMQCFSAPASAGNCDASSSTPWADLGYCAYHSTVTIGGTATRYAMMPDGGDHLRFCSGWVDTVYPYGPNGDQYADWEVSIDSHEFMETVTDPAGGSGWTDSSNGGEIGDLCAWVFPTVPLMDDRPNMLQNIEPFYTQPEWSNSNSACYQPDLPAVPTVSAVSVTAPSTVPSSGTAYIWVNDTVSANPAGWGNLSVDFPTNPSTGTISVVTSTFPTTPTVLPTGTMLVGCYSTCPATASTYPVVLGKTSSWAAGTTYGFELAVTMPSGNTNFPFYVKGVVASPGSAYASMWTPMSRAQTDQQSENVTAFSITVGTGGGGGPTVGSPAPSPTSVDVGQSVTFTATVTGGVAPYTNYAWASTPSSGLGCPTTTAGASVTCTPTAANIYTLTLTVTDSGSHTGSATSGPFTVYPTPTVQVPTPSASSVQVGQTVTFSTTVGNPGSGSDTYAWSATPSGIAGCTPSASLSYSCVPTATGSFTATATVMDSNGGLGSNTSASVTVTPAAPSVSAPAASPASGGADVGQTVTWSATGSGGSAPYTYAWSTSPASGLGCPTSGAPPITCSPTASGTYTLTVVLTDSGGLTATATSASYQVSPLPSLSAPAPSPSSIVVGQTVAFTSTTVSAGSGGDSYVWSVAPTTGLSCPSVNALTVTCTSSAAGTNYVVSVAVTDSNGGTSTATSAPYTVQAAGGTLTAAASVTPRSGTAPLTVTFSGSAAGGTPAFTWSWAFGDGGTSTLQDPTHTYSIAGTYAAVLTVTDSAGHTATATAPSVSVASSGTGGLVVTASGSPNPATAGQTVTFGSTVSGQSGTVAYAWRFGDGGTATSASPTHAFTTAGTYTVWLWVNDSAGHSATATVAMTVNAAPSGPGPSGGLLGIFGPLGIWGLLIVVLVVVAIVAAIALSRRKKSPPTEAATAGGPGYYPEPSSAYGAPPPGYGSPPPGYGAPAPGYGAPPPGYGAPPPGYGGGGAPPAPSPGTGARPPTTYPPPPPSG